MTYPDPNRPDRSSTTVVNSSSGAGMWIAGAVIALLAIIAIIWALNANPGSDSTNVELNAPSTTEAPAPTNTAPEAPATPAPETPAPAAPTDAAPAPAPAN